MKKKREKVIGTGWKDQPGFFQRVWKPKAPVEKPGVLRRGHWSRLRGNGWETGAFGPSQPVPNARFIVVGEIKKINCIRGQFEPKGIVWGVK